MASKYLDTTPPVAAALVRLAATRLMAAVALVSRATLPVPCCTTPAAAAAVGPRAHRRMPVAKVVVAMVVLERMMDPLQRPARMVPAAAAAVAAATRPARTAAAALSLFAF